MREAFALVRASWFSATSYRLNMVMSLAALLVSVVPLYFITHALQPVMANAIKTQGGQYFGFLLVGMVAFSFVTVAVNGLAGAVRTGISTGTLEALLATRASLPSLLSGLMGYGFLWTGLRGVLLLAAGVLFGAHVALVGVPASVLVLVLLILSYVPFGILGAALVLAFRTTGPILTGVLSASALLGGVYYPTHVIPSWIRSLSDAVPLTYGLRALRRTLLEGASLRAVAPDLLILTAFVIVLMSLAVVALAFALRYARRAGTLAQY
ncbi:MAG TPA: ABC transporter permease [Gemmatimonadaceae bacterium]|nr:ABC transporter permease [Gemmatimonadaceae bacterium]